MHEIVTFRSGNFTVIIEHLEKYIMTGYQNVNRDLLFRYHSSFVHFNDALLAKDKFFEDYGRL